MIFEYGLTQCSAVENEKLVDRQIAPSKFQTIL